jgi:hypothetical protein
MKNAMFSVLCLAACQSAAAPGHTGLKDALSHLEGGGWSGTLTYLNYSEPVQDFTIPATLNVTEKPDGFEFAYGYPDEPDQNSTGVVEIGANDKTLDGQTVKVHEYGRASFHRIVMEGACEDMGRAAMCETEWTISASAFSTRKMVKPADGSAPFRRNEYTFTR